MADRDRKIETNGPDGQRIFSVQNMSVNDESKLADEWRGISGATLFVYGAGTFSVELQASPTGQRKHYLPIVTATQTAPVVGADGPFGTALRVVVKAASAPVEIIVVSKESR